MARSSVILGGQVLHGRDHFGDWRVSKLDPWFETPAVKGESVERGNADGEYDLPTSYGARIIPFSGRVLCDGPAQVRAAANRLTGLLHGGLVTMQVTDAGGTTWAKVKRNGPTVPVKVNDRMLRFQFDVKAPDARRFGNVNEFTAKVDEPTTVFHRGNYEAPPRFVVSGYAPGGYALVINGRRFNVTHPVVTASPHTIDYDDGRLRIGGTVVHGGLGSTATPHIPPGRSISVEIVPLTTGTPTAKLTLLDTYI